MAKLTNFKTPTGQAGNLLNPSDWVSLILGGVVLIFTFAASQNIAKMVSGAVPFADSKWERPFEQEQKQQKSGNDWRVA